jgi:PST family polysaccharide transporter
VSLLKAGLISSVNIGTKMLGGIVVNKLLAIYIGPSGYVIFGQFQSLVSALTTLGGAGIGSGITKYTAEYKNDSNRQQQIWSVSIFIVAISTVLSIIFLFLMGISEKFIILKNEDFKLIILLLVVSMPFYSINMVLLSILNGKKDVRAYSISSIWANIISAIAIGASTWLWSLNGALASAVMSQVIICMITIKICSVKNWFQVEFLLPRFEPKIARSLFHFTAMVGVTAILSPITLIIIRSHLIEVFGLNAAGCWEGINRLSNMYLMFLITPLSIYFLPKISELNNNNDLKKEIIHTYKILVPISILMSLAIYLSKDIIIRLIFTNEFEEMSRLFLWQMVGDIFKISAWILSFYLVAKKMTVIFITTELIFNFNLILLTYVFSSMYDFEGTTMAYATNNIIAFSMLFIIVIRRLNRNF